MIVWPRLAAIDEGDYWLLEAAPLITCAEKANVAGDLEKDRVELRSFNPQFHTDGT